MSSSCGTSPTSPTSSSSAPAGERRAEACTTRSTTRTATTTTGTRTPSSSASPEAVEPNPTPTPAPPRAPRLPPPLFSWGYLGVCLLVFLPHAQSLNAPERFLLYGPAVAEGEWWRVLTSAVEHIGPLHILANGLSIWSFGPIVERQIGSWRMFTVSLVTALTAAAAALGFLWLFPSAGASGVICGWLGLALLIFSGRARRVLLQWTFLIVMISLIPGVSWAAHLGGFVGG